MANNLVLGFLGILFLGPPERIPDDQQVEEHVEGAQVVLPPLSGVHKEDDVEQQLQRSHDEVGEPCE